ncbi:hypothetical protein [Thermoflavimicrobium dichotomicum]|uniref:Uncharacterized protein n=1 Tax=Thermoflavimicrobium dichotomicum TaxID=46223 RepID=A0A1I3UYP6_9BACL|nr:hypothetical protein [Thermoflavimicrobium dichotomicum]SFJ87186.1 hypothetical protein SAMN05421852_1294 [Thermoflavimicrobium dichotomicum]
MLMEQGYQEFQQLVMRYIHLEVLILVLQQDLERIRLLKMGSIYAEWLGLVIDRINSDLGKMRRKMKSMNGKIVEVIQKEKTRLVKYKHRGYLYEEEYLNSLIKVECEKLLKQYLKNPC